MAPIRWDGGWQWGPASDDARTAYWGPVTAATRPVVSVSINGILQPTVNAASWRLGRDGWFGNLTPCNASLSFVEPATGAIGDPVMIHTDTGLLWTGTLENITTTKRLDDGGYTSTVSAVDGLARHGLARITSVYSFFSGYTLATLIPHVMGVLGLDPLVIVEGDSATALPTLLNTTSVLDKTVLEYLQLAEKSSNALMTLQPDGTLLAVTRDAVVNPDYMTNGDFEVDTAGWSAYAGGSIARSTTTPISGVADGQVTCTTTQYSGAVYPITGTFLAGETYRLSMMTELISGESDWYIQLYSTIDLAPQTWTTFTATSTPILRYVDFTPLADVTDMEVYVGAIDAVPVAGVLAIDDVTVRRVTDVLDLVGIDAPRAWTVATEKSSVINHWSFVTSDDISLLDEKDTASIAAYGESAYAISDYMDNDIDAWSSDMRAVLAEPRPIATGEFPIHSSEQAVTHLSPLDWVSFDGDTWQVMSVEHTVSPSEWSVRIVCDVSQNFMAGEAEPDAGDPDDDGTTTTLSETFTSTKSATVVKSSSGTFLGNGAGNYLPVGYYSGFRHRALIDFTTLSKPVGYISVKKATLNLRTTGQQWVAFGSKPKFYARRIKTAWSEGTYDAAPTSQYSTTNAVVWPGPDLATAGQTLKSISAAESNDISVDVTDQLQAALDANAFRGFGLVAANENSNVNCVEFYSDDHGTSGFRPELVVVWRVS